MSDHKGARIVLNALPKADCLIADKGYDSTWFRQELLARASLSDLAKKAYGGMHLDGKTLTTTTKQRSRDQS